MDKKLRETTNLCRNNEQQTASKEETWSRGTNSRLPSDVNVVINLFNQSIHVRCFSAVVSGKGIKKFYHINAQSLKLTRLRG